MKSRVSRTVLASCVLAIAACESTGPEMSEVAGAYTATTLTTTTAGVTTNELAGGATVSLVLTPVGGTTGTLFIPDGNEDGSDLTANLTGAWSLDDRTVHLSHSADTFLRDMPLTVSGNTLVGDRTFGGTRVQLTLTKQ
jgi:hypothetical protein